MLCFNSCFIWLIFRPGLVSLIAPDREFTSVWGVTLQPWPHKVHFGGIMLGSAGCSNRSAVCSGQTFQQRWPGPKKVFRLAQEITVANLEQHHNLPRWIWETQQPMFHINIQCRPWVKHEVKTLSLHIRAAVLFCPLSIDVKEVLGGWFTRAAAELTGVDRPKVVLGCDSDVGFLFFLFFGTKLINHRPEL